MAVYSMGMIDGNVDGGDDDNGEWFFLLCPAI